jgi:hypothetical protein
MIDKEKDLPLRQLVMGPAIVTLFVTLLRLTGELQGWSETFFSRKAGGGGAVVGISWLVLLFGLYFGWKLATWGYRPQSGARAAGLCVLALVLAVGMGFGANALKLGLAGQFATIALAGLIAAAIAYRAWPALGKVLLAYALAARIPVIIVMLIAILGNWGTHYDVVPPDFPAMGVWSKWLLIGVLPQLTIWIGFTVVVGMLMGLVGAVIVRKHAFIEVGREIIEATKQGR